METNKILTLIHLFDIKRILTSNEIGQSLHVSDRTVRNYMKELNLELSKHGAHINARPGSGYEIIIDNNERYQRYYQLLNQEGCLPENSKERIKYILEYLLFNQDETISSDELSDKLCVSKATINTDIKEVKHILKDYNLKIEYENRSGYKISGSEFAYRLCVAACLHNSFNFNQEQDQRTKIQKILLDLFEKSNFNMSDFAFKNLITHICVAINRVENANPIPELLEIDEQVINKYELAEMIIRKLEEVWEIRIPDSEIGYIAVHLAGKQTIDENMIINEEAYKLSDKMIQIVKENYEIDFASDINLKMVLAMHLIPLKMRIKYDMTMKNPMLHEIKENYSLAYAMSCTACSVLENVYGREVKEDEVGYFALHFNLALERKNHGQKKTNILIVCATGRGSAELMAYRFRQQFDSYLNEIHTCEASQVGKQDLSAIDYVITTVNIAVKIDRPILQVNYFLENSDIQSINQIFKSKTISNVSKFFSKSLFFTDLESKSRDEALKELITKTSQIKELPPNYFELVKQRESYGTTEFGNLVAVPHPCIVLTEETFVSVGILKQPIRWNYKKVQFIFMLSMGKDEAELKDFYAVVSQFLLNKNFVLEVIKTKDYDKMMLIFTDIMHRMEE